MATHDPAFQWETEMLRASQRQRAPVRRTAGSVKDSDEWLTVREASEATGIPTSTIRKWVRHDHIPSFMEQTSDGDLRIVSMSGIRRWTNEIGRELDLSVEESTGAPTAVPEGSMLVPLDAWNRMLNQLGNLHEAGQQLAEARERAARAETEARFLKERLADLRDELNSAKEATTSGPDHGTDSVGDPSTPPSPTALVKSLYDGWRSRRRGRR